MGFDSAVTLFKSSTTKAISLDIKVIKDLVKHVRENRDYRAERAQQIKKFREERLALTKSIRETEQELDAQLKAKKALNQIIDVLMDFATLNKQSKEEEIKILKTIQRMKRKVEARLNKEI